MNIRFYNSMLVMLGITFAALLLALEEATAAPIFAGSTRRLTATRLTIQ